MIKIAFFNLYSGINNRGAESFVHELARLLAEKHQVDFYSGGVMSIKNVQNIILSTKITQPVHDLNILKLLFLDRASIAVLVFSLKAFLRLWRGNYDWIIPINGFWQVLLCKIINIFRGSKILITGHSGPGWDERWNLYLKPDVFAATTQPSAQWARKACPWTKVVTIPYGIDIETFSKAKPVKLGLERPIILCPAAAVPYKRVDLAIRAVSKLKKGSLLHLGTGPLLGEIREIGERLLGKKRFLSQAVGYENMPEYYAACDIVTLPSSPQENSPMVFLEAMAAGKMTVTTDAPRPRWILGGAGIFIDPENTSAYAKALGEALSKKDEEIVKRQAEKYAWARILTEYDKLISSPLQT